MFHKEKNIARLHFVTSDDAVLSHLEQMKLVLDNGVEWVQLRAKNISEKEFLYLAEEAKELTEKYQATLVINDYHLVASMVEAEGLHIGKEDVAPQEARKFLMEQIIGGTANDLQDIQRIISHVDYIGLGPLRFTSTKKKLSPTLGFEGFKNIISSLTEKKPIIAIGGIVLEDIPSLMEIGVHGIALSGAIIYDVQPAKKTKEFIKVLEQYEGIKA